jgi:ABC-type nitrate/sulfonate/bicarbonate transport system permease component
MRIRSSLVENWLIPTAVVASWELLGRVSALPPYLSYPSQILAALWEVTADGELPQAAAVSLYRVLAGFAIGTIVGVCVGLGAGLVRGVRNFFDPLVSFLFAVPKIAFLPVFLLLFGIGSASKIAIVAFSCFFPVFIASCHSVLSVNKLFLWAAQNMGTPPHKLFFRVLIPAAAPQLFAGVRISLAHAFIVLFAAELIGSHAGLGVLIAEGENAARFDLMFAGIVAFAVLGFVSDRILLAVRARVLKGSLLGTEEKAAV